ncbi:MAG TPA: fatty acid desaturase [Dongiaceae bacterium]|nr:fatty acid desaturase [Dongiaceae bacterium]
MPRTLYTARYRRLNLMLLALMAGLTAGALFAVPLWLLPRDLRWGWLLVPVALLTNLFWALHHEAIHGGFHGDRRGNLLAGRIMAILLGSSFHVLRFGHLMHHRYNRNPVDRPDAYDPAAVPRARARLGFLANLVIGLYLAELVAPAASWLPRSMIWRLLDRIYRGSDPALAAIRLAAHRAFLDPRRLGIIRADAFLAVALVAASAAAFGRHWPMLLGFLGARGALISVLDNVYHFGTPIDRPDYARNLWLPAPLRLLILNMNLHRVHHLRPALPWWALPAQLRASGDGYDAPLLRTAAAQFGGPIPVAELRTAGSRLGGAARSLTT